MEDSTGNTENRKPAISRLGTGLVLMFSLNAGDTNLEISMGSRKAPEEYVPQKYWEQREQGYWTLYCWGFCRR